MAAYNKFNSFVAAIANKLHNLGSDQLMIALTDTAPVATNTQLSNITEITYTNVSTRVISTISCTQTSGTLKLLLTDLVLTASGAVGPFRYVVVYNNTATNKELICWFDDSREITLANGETYTIDFDGTNGLFTLI